MRKLGLSEHFNTLRIVSSDPSIHYFHVPSPCGVLIEMSRGIPNQVCEAAGTTWQVMHRPACGFV
jgi:hypothetical protein